eukprot:TRINITY_DN23727_c0_g1_i1.p1 TRINITY_DN23727_c0_g1~~TRINITY_DN23727_c0_g1_i1.p1  ORF type:complete len:867 (-),score=212.74 TRINITY_DN23727_c0_g1_i1:42-2642(-)
MAAPTPSLHGAGAARAAAGAGVLPGGPGRAAETDELARHYTARAETTGGSAREREAAVLFSVAEGHLNDDEDFEEALKAAKEALAVFRDVGDSKAVADTLRLIVHAHKAKAELLRFAGGEGGAGDASASEALRDAEEVVQNELEQFRKKGDHRSVGAMLLSLAEVHSHLRTADKREEACKAAQEARELFGQLNEPLLLGSAAYVLANLFVAKLHVHEAAQAAREALECFQQAGDRKREAKSLHVVAIVHMLEDRFQDGIEAAKQSLSIFRELQLSKMIAFELHSIANWCLGREKAREAIPYAREASELFKKLSYGKGWQAASLSVLIQALVQSGDVQRGLSLGQQALAQFEQAGDLRGKVFVCDALVHAQLGREEVDEALVTATDGLAACRKLGDRRWEAQMLRTVSAIHSHSREWDKASRAVQDAQALSQELGDRAEEAEMCSALARLYVVQKDFKSALVAAEEQREIFLQTGERAKQGQALLLSASVKGMDGDLAGALQDAQQSRQLYKDLGDAGGEGGALLLLGDIHLANEEFASSLESAAEARKIFDASKQLKLQAQAHALASKAHLAQDVAPTSALKSANEAVALARKCADLRLEVEMLTLASQAQASVAMAEAAAARDDQSKIRAMGRGGDKAHKFAQDAMRSAKKLRDQGLIAASTYAVASAQLVAYRFPQALSAADDAVLKFQALEDKAGEVAATLVRAEVHFLEGKSEKATEVATKAMTMAKACKDAEGEYRAYQVLQRIQEEQRGGGTALQNLAPGAGAGAAAAAAPVVEEEPGLDPEAVLKMVSETVNNAVGGDDEILTDSPLMDSGLDSLSAVAFRNDLQKAIGFTLPAALIFDYPTPRAIVGHLVEVSKTKKK